MTTRPRWKGRYRADPARGNRYRPGIGSIVTRTLSATEDEWRRIDVAADQLGVSRSAFVRLACEQLIATGPGVSAASSTSKSEPSTPCSTKGHLT